MKVYLALFTSIIFCTQLWAQPMNDDCLNAIVIPTTSEFCSGPMEFNNIGANPDLINPPSAGQMAIDQCIGIDYSNGVWFILFPEQPGLLININCNDQNGTCLSPSAVLFTGSCTSPDGFIYEDCTPGNTAEIAEYLVTELTVGQRYYLYIETQQAEGTFQICVDDFVPVPSPNSDCPTGVVLCNTDPFQVDALDTEGAMPNELSDFVGRCLNREFNSAWYRWTCEDSGSLTFTLTPNNSPEGQQADDLDFALFQLPGGINDCPNKDMIRCMASGGCTGQPFTEFLECNGPTGLAFNSTDTEEFPGCFGACSIDPNVAGVPPQDDDNFVASIDMVQGESYALVVMNFSTTGQGFSIDFDGSGTFAGPQADFMPNPVGDTLACEREVIFTDLSTFGTADPIVSYTWNFGADAEPPTATTQGPHSVEYSTFGDKFATLTVESAGGCLVTEIIEVRVGACCDDFDEPILDVTVGDFVCPGEDNGSLSFEVISGGTPEFNFNVPGISEPGIFIPNPSVGGLPAGTYTVLVQDARGCLDTITETIPEPDPLSIDAGLDILVDLGILDTLNATVDSPSTNLTFMWDPEDGLECPGSDVVDCPNPLVLAPGTQTYSVTVTDERGCISVDQVTVTTNIIRPIFCPNIITPATRSDNSLWRLGFGRQAVIVREIYIYDRWGNEIYKDFDVPINADNEMERGWDGRFPGNSGGPTQFVTPGVYAWLAKIRFIDREEIYFSGDITVLK